MYNKKTQIYVTKVLLKIIFNEFLLDFLKVNEASNLHRNDYDNLIYFGFQWNKSKSKQWIVNCQKFYLARLVTL